ncbi:crosslink repair DNA glycosylase YcaQ family protein [Actinomycetaceae bacterium MB13-C1-2]|nr:crosslink repair DNA glycosylase YcaQ family protein [Actinomycetaceae bacterium MB13-C1-2]
MTSVVHEDPLSGFSAPARAWFRGAFAQPTEVQREAWKAIRSRSNALVIAPTGSGKTLAAFMWAIDSLAKQRATASGESERDGVRILYISPLKALGVDVERNLRAPLAGIREASVAAGLEAPDISVGVRSGDTTASERRRLISNPPDILITTPESLYLLLTSAGAETLKSIDTVILDEVHALAGNKRGAHLALSLERLDMLLEKPAQRIGLSATVEPVLEVARFLGGAQPVEIVHPRASRKFDITVEVPVPDMSNPPVIEPEVINAGEPIKEHRLGSMWPSIEQSLYERIMDSRSTIVFANSRRLAERLTARLNQIHEERTQDADSPVLARAHHGSVSKEIRAQVEEDLKSGVLRCVVATGSLELGIDMGEVDLVVQIDPPPSVSSGLQRLGRSGHQVGGTSRAVFYPTHRSKLLETAVISRRMSQTQIEPLSVLSNPLDVLAQQTIAQAAVGPLEVEKWFETARRAAPFRDLPKSAYGSVLDLISGKFPSTEFASLRARVDWDRAVGTLSARPGAKRLAVTGGGTIPDRGLYRVVTGNEEDGHTRVGELDEEMVHETRVGEVFSLGTTSWRVRNINRDSVEVEPAFGTIAKTPFWRGDSMSRPVDLGRALGETGKLLTESERSGAEGYLAEAGFDSFAIDNTLTYLSEQVAQTGQVPTADSLVVEKTRDEVGDWLYVLESPLGLAVHSPWALAINARLRDRWGLETKATPSNDGIIVRVPDMDLGLYSEDDLGLENTPSDVPSAEDIFLFEPDEITRIVRDEIQGSAVFAARFREASSRALILGNSKPGKRSPLWQQRLRASELLEVASRYPDFPMILEAVREVLQDVYDTGALGTLMHDLTTRRARLTEVVTETPSPFARSLLFGYVGEFLYEGDAPAGERRIAALTVDPEVLRELLGEVPLRDLLEADAITEVESELQRTRDGWQFRGTGGLVDLVRMLGPLTVSEIANRLSADNATELEDESQIVKQTVERASLNKQVFMARIGGTDYVAAVEDAGILVQASGVPLPPGLPSSFLEPSEDPAHQLLARYARTHGPFTEEEVASRFALAPTTVHAALRDLEARGLLSPGLFLPAELADDRGLDADHSQWVERTVLDRIRVRSLALLRGAVEPVGQTSFAEFLAEWQHYDTGKSGRSLRGSEGLYSVLDQLSGLPIPASAWETLVLPNRILDYDARALDSLVSGGEFMWIGAGRIGNRDGWIKFLPTGTAPTVDVKSEVSLSDLESAVLDELGNRGALFAGAIIDGLVTRGLHISGVELAEAIWTLAWMGLVTSDSVQALRARVSGKRSAQKTAQTRLRGRSLTRRGMTGLSLGRGVVPDPTLVGRWSLVQPVPASPTTESYAKSADLRALSSSTRPDTRPSLQKTGTPRSHADTAVDTHQLTTDAAATLQAVEMLERYGVVTRGSVVAEDFPGGFAQAYRFYSDFEVSGSCKRGYFIEGLGGAQFAVPGAVDRLREIGDNAQKSVGEEPAWTLAATDPANPYGAALPWPEGLVGKRNAGALVTLVGGDALLYIERGGKTVLAREDADESRREVAVRSLVETVRRAGLATFTVEKLNGKPVRGSVWANSLTQGGFEEVPRGLTLRRKIH